MSVPPQPPGPDFLDCLRTHATLGPINARHGPCLRFPQGHSSFDCDCLKMADPILHDLQRIWVPWSVRAGVRDDANYGHRLFDVQGNPIFPRSKNTRSRPPWSTIKGGREQILPNGYHADRQPSVLEPEARHEWLNLLLGHALGVGGNDHDLDDRLLMDVDLSIAGADWNPLTSPTSEVAEVLTNIRAVIDSVSDSLGVRLCPSFFASGSRGLWIVMPMSGPVPRPWLLRLRSMISRRLIAAGGPVRMEPDVVSTSRVLCRVVWSRHPKTGLLARWLGFDGSPVEDQLGFLTGIPVTDAGDGSALGVTSPQGEVAEVLGGGSGFWCSASMDEGVCSSEEGGEATCPPQRQADDCGGGEGHPVGGGVEEAIPYPISHYPHHSPSTTTATTLSIPRGLAGGDPSPKAEPGTVDGPWLLDDKLDRIARGTRHTEVDLSNWRNALPAVITRNHHQLYEGKALHVAMALMERHLGRVDPDALVDEVRRRIDPVHNRSAVKRGIESILGRVRGWIDDLLGTGEYYAANPVTQADMEWCQEIVAKMATCYRGRGQRPDFARVLRVLQYLVVSGGGRSEREVSCLKTAEALGEVPVGTPDDSREGGAAAARIATSLKWLVDAELRQTHGLGEPLLVRTMKGFRSLDGSRSHGSVYRWVVPPPSVRGCDPAVPRPPLVGVGWLSRWLAVAIPFRTILSPAESLVQVVCAGASDAWRLEPIAMSGERRLLRVVSMGRGLTGDGSRPLGTHVSGDTRGAIPTSGLVFESGTPGAARNAGARAAPSS